MAGVLICLDSGTTAVKAAAFAADGRMLATAQRDNAALRRDGSFVEQDMEATRADAFAVLRECAQRSGAAVEGVLVTGQGDGLWPLGADNRPAGPALTWLDGRARGIVDELAASGVPDEIRAVTGSRPTAASQSVQLVWMKRFEPARFDAVAKALRLKEWLFLSLTGVLLGEASAALPVWGDYRTGRMSRAVQSALGLPRGVELLPDFAEAGACRAALSQEAAAATGIAQGTPVLQGPGDVQSALIGLGLGGGAVTRASIFGTSAIHACHVDDPGAMRGMPPGAILQRFVLGPGYLCFHPSFNGGELLRHIGRLTGTEPASAGPAYSGLVLHPFFEAGGERAPFTDPYASGAAFGLTAQTSPRELAWAAREALAFVAAVSHDMMDAPPGALALGGGLAGDRHFARFLASVLGVPVGRAADGQAGLRGLGVIGARFLLSVPEAGWRVAPDEVVEPDAGIAAYAREKLSLFRRLVDAVSPHWKELAALRERAQAPGGA